jgi:hypothetical protein
MARAKPDCVMRGAGKVVNTGVDAVIVVYA